MCDVVSCGKYVLSNQDFISFVVTKVFSRILLNEACLLLTA